MNRLLANRLWRTWLLANFLTVLARGQSAGSITYNYLDLSSGAPALQLASINANGTGDVLVPIAVRNAAYPTWSRDGQWLAVAGTDPARPSKWSTDLFVLHPATGQLAKWSAFEDTANASGFLTFFPSYLAFSRDNQRVAAGMVSYAGARGTTVYTNEFGSAVGPYETTSKISRCVSLVIFSADGTAPFLVASGLCDDDNAHPGEGVDWSPTQDLIAYPYNAITSFGGAGGQFPITSIQLIEPTPNAADQGRRRRLTFPSGSTGFAFEPYALVWADDFAPAFSPDGQQVAYVRTQTAVTSAGVKLPSQPSLRIVGTDGSNDRTVATFNVGDYITRVSWAPDGKTLVFDLGRQALRDGFPLRTFDVGSVRLATIQADGAGFQNLRGAPATWPTWRPGSGGVTPPVTGQAPSLTAQIVPGLPPRLVLAWPDSGQPQTVESTPVLGTGLNWQPINEPVVNAGGQHRLNLTLDGPARFFRLRQP